MSYRKHLFSRDEDGPVEKVLERNLWEIGFKRSKSILTLRLKLHVSEA